MSKEGELKLIDLRVSVHCCDGCKKKVKKALQAIEGVVRSEIHSSQPRVTVEVRMVEPQILIKRLAKIGKPAELWTNGGGAAQPKDKHPKESSKGGNNDNSKESSKSNDGKCKSAEENVKSASKFEEGDKSKKNETSVNGETDKGGKKCEKEANGAAASSNNALPEVTKTVNTLPEDCTIKAGIVHLGNTGAYSPYSYAIAPPPPPPPPPAGPQVCYMVTAYSAPPVYFAQDPHYSELRVSRQHRQTIMPSFDDYFDDDNTVGCSIM